MKKTLYIFAFIFLILGTNLMYAEDAQDSETILLEEGEEELNTEEPEEINKKDEEDAPEEVQENEEDVTTQEDPDEETSNEDLDTEPVDENENAKEDTSADTVEESFSLNLFVRSGEIVVFDNTLEIQSGTTTIFDIQNTEHSIDNESVLGILTQLDTQLENFSITQIEYYTDYDALYIKCAQVDEKELCDNWQYVLNGESPFTSVEQTQVAEEDAVIFYFGQPYQVIVPESVNSNEEFTVFAQMYQYITHTWAPRLGITFGLTTPNPDDPWSPTIVSTQASDEQGGAVFTVESEGDYGVAIEEDWYYPIYPLVITVATPPTSGGSTGGGSGSEIIQKDTFSIASALDFLRSVQDSRGSFARSQLYSDWAAIAFASVKQSNDALFEYIQSNTKVSDILTDTIRRAMTLLILGENPYSFGGTNYIESIVGAFDGVQIGESYLVNDDIFALLVLQKVGYKESDEIISKLISFILSNQRSNGSWENSADLTSAAIQALYNFSNKSEVSQSINSAVAYLKSTQQSNGGWGDVYATSWVLLAQNLLGEQWTKNSNSGIDFLAQNQQEDGGVLSSGESIENRIWATSYAIVSARNTSWIQSMRSVSKQEITQSNSGSTTNADTEVEENENQTEEVQEVEEELGLVLGDTTAPVLEFQQVASVPTYVQSYTTKVATEEPIQEEVETIEQDEKDQKEIPSIQSQANIATSNIPLKTIFASGLILFGLALIFGRRFFV